MHFTANRSIAASLTSADEREIALGREAGESIEKYWARIIDPAKTARLNMLLHQLAPEIERPFPYEVRIISEDGKSRPNAFALPGGLFYVNRGMLDFVKSDEELAGIMAHELAHIFNSHGIKQAARNERLAWIALAAAIAAKGDPRAFILANVAQAAVTNSYSLEYETEADREGLLLMQRAGFDPTGMVTVMERLAEERMKYPQVELGVFQTHPESEQRMAALVELMKDHGWPVRRKKTLGLLRVQVLSDDSGAVVQVDGRLVWGAGRGDDAEERAQDFARRLDANLELETLPHDLALEKHSQGDFLRIGNERVLEEPLPLGAMPLEEAREKLIFALNMARTLHPMGQYMK